MNEKEVMLNAFSKYFNKTDEELTEMLYEKTDDGTEVLKDGVVDQLIALDTNRVERLRKEATEGATRKFDDFAKKSKKEVMEKFEKDIKEQYGLESDKTGIELVNELAAKFGKTGNLTEDSIKTNPIFIKLESEWKENATKSQAQLQKEFDEFKYGVERNGQLNTIKSVVETEFLKLNPVLSENPVIAKNQTQEFLNRFQKYEYIINDGNIMVKNGDGRLEDGHGNPISFDAFVKSEAEKLYDFKVQDPRGSAGNTTGGGTPGKITMTKKEYGEAIALAERNKDKEAFVKLANVTVV
jgi:hypothetical protein